ncbi:unnamed protein product, partial [Mesorhabditis spiculigera]
MSYKCRPVSFESASFCEGEQMAMQCREGRRMAIHAAEWTHGRETSTSTQPGTSSCSLSPGREAAVKGGCGRDVLSELLSCHGQPVCSMPLDEKRLGKTCGRPNALHVTFVCVNEEIFSEETLRGELQLSKHFKYLEGSGNGWEEEKPAQIEQKPPSQPQIPPKESKPKPEKLKKEAKEKPDEKREVLPREIAVEEHIEHSMRDQSSVPRGPSGPSFNEPPPPILLSDAEMRGQPLKEEEEEVPVEEENPNFVGVAHDVLMVAKFFGDHSQEALWVVGIGVALCVCLPLAVCLCFCRATQRDKNNGKIRYSIETSQLFAKGSQMLDGPSHLIDIGDLPEDTYIR